MKTSPDKSQENEFGREVDPVEQRRKY